MLGIHFEGRPQKGSRLRNVSIKGVVIGSITDIVTTNLLALPVVFYVVATHNFSQIPKEQISSILTQILKNDPALFAMQILSGSACSVLGGYVAARIAKRHEILNGGLAAFLCVGGGLYALLFGTTSFPLWQHLLGFVASPALSSLGGYLRLRSVRKKSNI